MRTPPLLEGPKRPNPRAKAWLWPTLILAVVGLGILWWRSQPQQHSDSANYNPMSQEHLKRRQPFDAEYVKREAQGTILLHSNRISETEEISIVELPPSARAGIMTPGYYAKCIIYKNSEYRTVRFICGSGSAHMPPPCQTM